MSSLVLELSWLLHVKIGIFVASSSGSGFRSSSSLLEGHLEYENPSKNQDCPTTLAILTCGGLDGRLINNNYDAVLNGLRNPCGCWTRRLLLTSSQYCEIVGITGTISSVIFTFPKKWEKSLRGTVKFNFDAAVSNTETGYGIIVRDFEGFIIGRSFGFKKEEMVSDWVKIYAFEEILKLARKLNITKATFEIDCATLTNRIKKRNDDIALMG
ncbi:hypothetical protein Gotri_012698 [Gossypium trilobum]|uniref:RNase H type-1 domain-containing protein n=1 Tax=Gossypium trilobum TaxID=34281 RepID=A0A7J9DR70_9ROSI|nr:hypothetical protein [Gossypium trilobum]